MDRLREGRRVEGEGDSCEEDLVEAADRLLEAFDDLFVLFEDPELRGEPWDDGWVPVSLSSAILNLLVFVHKLVVGS